MTKEEKRSVTFVFDDEEMLDDFLGYMSDGGGEYGYIEYVEPKAVFDYKECFSAWGWKGKSPRKVIVRREENE